MCIYPTNGLEYAGNATDALDAVSGLLALTEGLLALPQLSAASRQRLQACSPPVARTADGHAAGRTPVAAAGAEVGARLQQMGADRDVRRLAVPAVSVMTQPATLQLARDTWETVPADRARLCKQDYSWMANVANMAALAWPEKAKERAIYKLANTAAPQARFPAFFGPGHDWLPDHNWGGSGMTGLQEMLLAPEPGKNGKLHLFPAWPAEWDVDFKLHAPGPTVVEASAARRQAGEAEGHARIARKGHRELARQMARLRAAAPATQPG
jgi:hypothetical protein